MVYVGDLTLPPTELDAQREELDKLIEKHGGTKREKRAKYGSAGSDRFTFQIQINLTLLGQALGIGKLVSAVEKANANAKKANQVIS